MPVRHNLTGQSFGNLTALRFSHKRKGTRFWVFSCVCGAEKAIASADVKRGRIKSCGCRQRILQRNAKLFDGPRFMVAAHDKFQALRRDAKTRGYEWVLSFGFFLGMATSSCANCGLIPRQRHRQRDSTFFYTGIDRIENSRGY